MKLFDKLLWWFETFWQSII